MAGRRGARAGRGWDAIPPRPVNPQPDDNRSGDDPPGGEPWPDETRRGNVSARRRQGAPGAAGAGRPFGRAQSEGRGEAGESRGAEEARQSEPERAREICLRQLAVRPRTRAELAKVLARKEISEEVIAEVLDRYDEVGIIDDAAFARAWVSSRHHGRGLARRALAGELRRHGVDAEVASEALATLDEEDEETTARSLVDRKLRTATGTPEALFRRLAGMLARKGYPAGLAYRVVKEALAARDEEAAQFADGLDTDALADE
jgi:regulatory protein